MKQVDGDVVKSNMALNVRLDIIAYIVTSVVSIALLVAAVKVGFQIYFQDINCIPLPTNNFNLLFLKCHGQPSKKCPNPLDLLSHVSGQGQFYLIPFSGRGTGMTWSTLYDRPNPSDSLTMGSIWLMFLVDILFYSLLISYLDKVRYDFDSNLMFILLLLLYVSEVLT